jgi:hypothetical protein
MKLGALFLAGAISEGNTNSESGILQRAGEAWEAVDQKMGGTVFIILGGIAFLAGVAVWWGIRTRIHNDRNFVKQIPSIIAHVHRVHPAYHILGAILGFSGLSLIAGFLWVALFKKDATAGSYMMTSAGMALGILTLVLSIWTLNQTMRLERLQGEAIERFDQLILTMVEDLRALLKRYKTSQDKSSDLFRVILVTNNPFFGIISYRGENEAQEFKNAFDALADLIKDEKAKDHDESGFYVKLICAEETGLKDFTAPYFEPGDNDSEDRKEELQKKGDNVVKESEEFIKSLKDRMGAECIVRSPIKISEAQFAVIGDVVFEFLLEPPDTAKSSWRARGSNINETNRIEDSGAADRFKRFARFLEELIKDGNSLKDGGGNSLQKQSLVSTKVFSIETEIEGKSAVPAAPPTLG